MIFRESTRTTTHRVKAKIKTSHAKPRSEKARKEMKLLNNGYKLKKHSLPILRIVCFDVKEQGIRKKYEHRGNLWIRFLKAEMNNNPCKQ